MINHVLLAADTASTQRVYAIIGALVVVGVLFAVLAWWLFRQTRVDPELLAPLEKMDERGWRESDPAEQHRLLDEVRPDGAAPLSRARRVPEIDPDLKRSGPPQKSLDDLAPARLSSAPAGGGCRGAHPDGRRASVVPVHGAVPCRRRRARRNDRCHLRTRCSVIRSSSRHGDRFDL